MRSSHRIVALPTILALFMAVFPTTALAQGTAIRVRLVAAGSGDKVHAGLADVAQLLRQNLPYSSFELLADRTIPATPKGQAGLARGYSVALERGEKNVLAVAVSRQGARVIDTRLQLRPNRPVILGGFADGAGGTLLIVISN